MKQLILLRSDLPESLLDLLADHIQRNEPQVFLIADLFVDIGQFLQIDILPTHNKEDEPTAWRVQIPVHFVLAIAQFRPSAKNQMGFVYQGNNA